MRLGIATSISAFSITLAAGAVELTPQDSAFFESKVRPLLVDHCYDCHSGAKNKGGLVVFNYVSKSPQVLGCSRLANGNTLVAEQGPPQAVEVNAKGEVVHITPLHTSHEHFHQQVRNLH